MDSLIHQALNYQGGGGGRQLHTLIGHNRPSKMTNKNLHNMFSNVKKSSSSFNLHSNYNSGLLKYV